MYTVDVYGRCLRNHNILYLSKYGNCMSRKIQGQKNFILRQSLNISDSNPHQYQDSDPDSHQNGPDVQHCLVWYELT